MRKVLSMIMVFICLTVIGTNSAMAKEGIILPPGVSVEEYNKLENMTLDELKAVAKPMPESAVKYIDAGNGIKLKAVTNYWDIPEDGNIYFIKDNAFGKNYTDFYKFICINPASTQGFVEYWVYFWYSEDSNVYKKDTTSVPNYNWNLYNQLIGKGGSNNNSNKKVYTAQRLYGSSRIDTSKVIAENFSSGQVSNVVIATGNNFPDALSGSVLAKSLNAPILLTGISKSDSTATLDYIKGHLKSNGTVYVLGGSGAVSEEIVQAIKDMGYTNIKRLWGDGRYDTCKAINQELNAPQGIPVILATGNDFPDALSISSAAAIYGFPILLTDKDTLPAQTADMLTAIKPSKVLVIGGEGVITSNVLNTVKSTTGLLDSNIVRLSGNNRYETSLAIAKYFKLNSDSVCFATGENFPDALAGSVLAAKLNAPVILVGNDTAAQKTYIDSTDYTKEIFFGGEGAINNNIVDVLSK